MSDNPASIPGCAPREEPRCPWVLPACVALVLAGLAAYSDGFNGPFIFDDRVIVDRSNATHLWPIQPILAAPRPVAQFSLALSHTLGGGVRGYHIFNVGVHLLAGLALFGVMRRTLTLPRLAGRFSPRSATALAFCTALLWTLHPLQTEAVSYVIQRAESMMGLFYLLTLYCLIRAASSLRSAEWAAASVLFCALGMGSKEVMASAPLVLLLYDRIFISGSFRETLWQRLPLYAGLTVTLLALAAPVRGAFAGNPASAGFKLAYFTPLQYASSQPGVILHYLALAFWPTGLCLDYNWQMAKGWAEIAPGAIGIALLLAATVLALVRRPMWGFAGVWFFLILAPTSSFMPIKDLAFEHRMYLPLAAIAAVAVVAVYQLSRHLARQMGEGEAERALTAELTALVVAVSAGAMLGALTWRRNADYQTAVAIWRDTTNKSRGNSRAWNNLSDALINAGDYTDVRRCCDEAIRLKPDFPEPYNNRGLWYAERGQYEEAERDYTRAIEARENFPMAYNNRAAARIRLGRYTEAAQDCRRAVELDPELGMAYYNLGIACSSSGDDEGAIEAYRKATELNWNYADVQCKLALLLQHAGRADEALDHYGQAIRLSPNDSEAYAARAKLRLAGNQFAEAIQDFDAALRLKPGDAEAYKGRAIAHFHVKEYAKAWSDVRACALNGGAADPEFIRGLARDSGTER